MALHDFGCDLISFANLENLAVDYLEKDGSFVPSMDTDNKTLP